MNGWEQRKDVILFFFGLCGIVFVVAVMPLLHYDFHYEYLIAFLAVLGIPIAKIGDKKDQNGKRPPEVKK